MSFVADPALCSKANPAALQAAPWSCVVAMPLRRSLKAAEQAQVLQTTLAAPCEVDGDLLWVREFDWLGRRLIVGGGLTAWPHRWVSAFMGAFCEEASTGAPLASSSRRKAQR